MIACAVRRVGERILGGERWPRLVGAFHAECRVHMRRRRDAGGIDGLELLGVVEDVGELTGEKRFLVVCELEVRKRGDALDVRNRQGGH